MNSLNRKSKLLGIRRSCDSMWEYGRVKQVRAHKYVVWTMAITTISKLGGGTGICDGTVTFLQWSADPFRWEVYALFNMEVENP